MGVGEFAVAAASILAAIGMVGDEAQRTRSLDASAFTPLNEATVRDVWPIASATLAYPHLDGVPLQLVNAVRSGSVSQSSPLHVCLTSTEPLDFRDVQNWHSHFFASSSSDGGITGEATYRVHIVSIIRASGLTESRQYLLRRLSTLLRRELVHFVEVVEPNVNSDRLPDKEGALTLILRDICGSLVAPHNPEAVLAIDVTHVRQFHALHIRRVSGGASGAWWRVWTPQHRYSAVTNYFAGQRTHFLAVNNASSGPGQPLILVDAFGTWEVEKLRTGSRAFFATSDGALPVLFLWSTSTPALLKASDTIDKAVALFLRALHRNHRWPQPWNTVVRTFDFGLTLERHMVAEDVVIPLPVLECAKYRLNVLEDHVENEVEVDGQLLKKQGVIGRILFTLEKEPSTCLNLVANGEPVQLCKPLASRRLTLHTHGEEPKACPYCSVIPLLSQQGYCAMAGPVPLMHRKTYGSYSDYGVFPRGMDGYDAFSLLEGKVTGDSQAPRFRQVSKYYPKETMDEDRPRILPTLVPVRLKKAK